MNANEIIFSHSLKAPQDDTEIVANELPGSKIPRIKNKDVSQVNEALHSEFEYLDDTDFEYIHLSHKNNFSNQYVVLKISDIEKIGPAKVLFFGSSDTGNYKVYIEDEWAQLYSLLYKDLRVQVVFTENFRPELDTIVINQYINFLIIEPSILIPSTLLSDSFSCLRRCILSLRTQAAIEDKRPTPNLIAGSICHEVFGEVFENNGANITHLERLSKNSMRNNMLHLQACKSDIIEAKNILDEFLESFPNWISIFFNKGFIPINPKNSQHQLYDGSQLKISKVLKVEENIWSTLYGIKGKIDSTVSLQCNTDDSGNSCKNVLVPFELKTGNNSSSIAHRSQTMFYTLMMSDKYRI
jgi:hypothetical protein